MRWPFPILLAVLAAGLAGCVHDTAPAPDVRVTLPEPPAELAPCFREAFPEIPARDLTTRDVVRIIGRAKVLDRAKTACGARAARWIEDVRRNFAR